MNFQHPDPSITRSARRRNHQRNWRRVWPYASVSLLAGLIAFGFWPQPLPVETARCSRGILKVTVNEEGKTRIKQHYTIAAPVTGQLRRIALKPGAPVHAAETVLAVIDPLPSALLDPRSRQLAEARRDTARANLEKSRVAHQFASKELKRAEKLFDDKTLSTQELESAQWREASAAKEELAAASALREAEAELAEFTTTATGPATVSRVPTEIKAPVDGCVLHVFQESIRVVSAGAPLIEIGDPADLEVVIEVLSRDGSVIEPGMKVELDQWGAPQPLLARVRLVEPAAFTKTSALGVEEQRVNVVADLVTPADQRRSLGDNFRLEARILIWEADRVLKVPAGALFRNGAQWALFAAQQGRARLRLVQAGRSNGRETQIENGLREGEDVILYPGDRVRDGQRIRTIEIGSPAR